MPSNRPNPTLGFLILDWIIENLAQPDRSDYEPYIPTPEQAEFILRFYEVDVTGRRRIFRRAVLSRPKGWGKSPLLSAICCAEALAPVVPDGFDAKGDPVGKPWSEVRTPWVQIAAVSEDQTKNAWSPLLEMLREGPIMDSCYGLEPLDTFVNLPKGRIEFVTASASSREGNRPCFAVLDQTESWTPGNGGVRLAATLRRNLGKTAGSSIEAPNAYHPGAGSVAESSAEAAKVDKSILYHHREAPRVEDFHDRPRVMAALEQVYGDSGRPRGGWVDLDRIAAEIIDPGTFRDDAEQFYFNRPVSPDNTWLDARDWAACKADPPITVPAKEPIAAGFDGSVYDDSTFLTLSRLSDGHLFVGGVWEKPEGQEGVGWEVDRDSVDAAVEYVFETFDLRLMFPDPWGDWRPYVERWASRWPGRVVEFDTRHKVKMCRALELFHADVMNRSVTHDGNEVLARHIANARKKMTGDLYTISKDQRKSPRKIDGAVSATLAHAARSAALDMPAPSSGRVYAFR